MEYEEILLSIRNSLTQREPGTLIDDAAQENAQKNVLDFAKAIADNVIMQNSPFCGSVYPELAKAIKPIAFMEIAPGALYYINEIVSGTLQENGKYLYKIILMNASSPTSSASEDIPLMEYIYEATALYTGLKRHVMVESDGSGNYGTIVIDWGKIPAGQQYICADFKEGCLFGISLLSYWASIGGSDMTISRLPMTEISEDSSVNGKSKMYIVKAGNNVDIIVDSVENILQEFEIKNNSFGKVVRIFATSPQLIDGFEWIGVGFRDSVKIIPNVDKLEVFGTYYEPPV